MGLFTTYYKSILDTKGEQHKDEHTDDVGVFSTIKHNEDVYDTVQDERKTIKKTLDGITKQIKGKIEDQQYIANNPPKQETEANNLSENELATESVYKSTRFDVIRERIFFGVMAVFIVGFILFFNHQLNKKNETLLSVIKKGQFKLNEGVKNVNQKLEGVDVKGIAEKAKEVAKNAS